MNRQQCLANMLRAVSSTHHEGTDLMPSPLLERSPVSSIPFLYGHWHATMTVRHELVTSRPPRCHAQYLAVLAGLNYTQRKQPNIDCGPVAWCSHVTPVDTPDTHLLDLLEPAGRLAAIELAQVSSIVHDVVARKDARRAPPALSAADESPTT